MHFVFTVISKVESGTLGDEHKYMLQGSFDAYSDDDSEPTSLGLMALPISSDDFGNVDIDDTIEFRSVSHLAPITPITGA